MVFLPLLAAVGLTLAAPLELAPRVGPSGQVISPAGGTVIDQMGDVLQFVYQPVTEATNPGYATQYVDLHIWDQDTDVTTLLAHALSSPDEEEDAIVSGLITANFSFASGGYCGNNLQLVVYEWQTGADAPLNGFQSAAPYFSIVNCYTPSNLQNQSDFGTWISPPEGTTIGAHRDSVLISYQAQTAEQFIPYSVDIDVEQNTSPIDEENAWTTVIHHLYTPVSSPASAYFSPLHWGFYGGFRITSYGFFSGVWFTSVSYHNNTVTDTY